MTARKCEPDKLREDVNETALRTVQGATGQRPDLLGLMEAEKAQSSN